MAYLLSRFRDVKFSMKSVAVGWVVVIIAGVSSFIWCKRDIDRRRLQALKLEQQEKRQRRPLTIGNAGRHA